MKCTNRTEKFLLGAVIVANLMINLSLARRLGIVGGETTNILNVPYQAGFLASGSLKCGACILSDNCALTAGHCVQAYSSNITLRVGSSFKDYGGRIVQIADVIKHPRFDQLRFTFDFALLVFKEPLEFDESIQPIKLPEDFEVVPDGTKCLVSGWGKMENDTRPQQIRSVEVFIVNQATCAKNYFTDRVQFRITSSMLCAGVPEGQKDSCSGDSGGPLVCNGKLFGDVSVGYGCGLKNFPGVYGATSQVREWIRSICGV